MPRQGFRGRARPGTRQYTGVAVLATTQQLAGYGPNMARQDLASLWLISFFIAPGPTV
jgi:hypothetical protein